MGIKNWWEGYANSHPKAAEWIREGGLFVIVSNLITRLQIPDPSISAQGVFFHAGNGLWMAWHRGLAVWDPISMEYFGV